MPRMPPRSFYLGTMGVIHNEPSSVVDIESSTIPRTSFLELEMEEDVVQLAPVKEERVTLVEGQASLATTRSHSAIAMMDTPSSDGLKKNVSFDTLHIREYSQVLGDHPCCSLGPPVSLGWDVKSEKHVSVEQYEATRTRRRSREDLRLSGKLRRELLSDVSDGAVRRVQRRLHRDKCALKGKAAERFFQNNTENSDAASASE